SNAVSRILRWHYGEGQRPGQGCHGKRKRKGRRVEGQSPGHRLQCGNPGQGQDPGPCFGRCRERRVPRQGTYRPGASLPDSGFAGWFWNWSVTGPCFEDLALDPKPTDRGNRSTTPTAAVRPAKWR